eukprot:1158259-Pelagomonas_calceolata.AAC.4
MAGTVGFGKETSVKSHSYKKSGASSGKISTPPTSHTPEMPGLPLGSLWSSCSVSLQSRPPHKEKRWKGNQNEQHPICLACLTDLTQVEVLNIPRNIIPKSQCATNKRYLSPYLGPGIGQLAHGTAAVLALS